MSRKRAPGPYNYDDDEDYVPSKAVKYSEREGVGPQKVKKHSLDSDEEEDEDERGGKIGDKNYDILKEEDIDGQEEKTLEFEGETQITPFNMKEEMEDGHFDGDGFYHFKKDATQIKDAWLDDIDWVKIKSREGDEKKYGSDIESDSDDEEGNKSHLGGGSGLTMPRSKKAQPQKTVQVDPSPGTSEENEPATPEAAPASAPAPVPAKQYRTAHKDIANYKFTAEQVKVLVEFIQANHCLYMNTHRGYANNKEKLTLWHQCAALFPGATYLQCRKYFEQKRTAYGKIEAAEMKSGSDVKPRTPREQEIMETWAFFKGHIAHASHTSSQRFSSGYESSSSSTDVSGLSAASIQRRKQLKKRRSEPSAATDETSPPAASPTVPAAAAAAAGASEAIINMTQILGSLLEAQRESRAESSEADDFGRMVGRSMKKLKQNQFHRCCIEIHQVIAKYQDAAEAPQAASPQQQQQLLPQKLPPQQQQQLLPQKLPPQHQQLPHQQPPATPQWAANFSTPTRDATPGPWMRDLLSPYTGPSTSGYQTPSTSGYQTPFVSYPQTTSTPASATQSAGPSTSTPASITVSSPQKTFLHAVTCIDRSLVAPLGNPISPLQTPYRPDLKRIAEEERLQNL